MSHSEPKRLSFPLIGLIASFILWAIIGSFLGFIFLIAKTPEPITSRESLHPESEEGSTPFFHTTRIVRYYKTQAFRHKTETLAKKLFASTTDEIEISSADLNSWAQSQFDTSINGGTDSAESKPYIAIIPETPEFQIAAGQLHINYPFAIEVLDLKSELMILSSGVFESENYTPQWKMDRLYLNSAPIPFKHVFYGILKPYVMKAVASNEEVEKITSAWNIIREIEIDGSTMIVRRK